MPSMSEVDPDARVVISVVVPVYRVEAYLPGCLDSLLRRWLDGFEVVAVDDASPDGCGRMLDERAREDARLRVVHLDANGGLGNARMTGLAHARGAYVWFVDGDDLVAEGALDAIVGRLTRCPADARPDVLLFDYARELEPGHRVPSAASGPLREPPAPDVFTATERPSVLDLMMTAWSRVFRRDFLLGLGLRFGDGYYEDVAVTYPALLAAERIAVLDRVCYIYRERRAGAITTTPGDRHFAVFGEYARVFAFADARGGRADPFRSRLFNRMIWHYTTIIDDAARVPPGSRRRFFHRMAADFRRYRPAGYRFPSGARGAKFRLVALDAYGPFRALRPVNRARLAARGGLRRLRRAARTAARRARAAGPLAYYHLQKRLPMDERLAVYSAYWYRGYACNPRAIYETARELAPHIRGVWVVRPDAVASLPEGVDHVVAGSPRGLRALARAKYLVNNVNFPHATSKRRGSVHVQTLHGTPAKTMGLDQRPYPLGARGMNFARLRAHSARWDYVLSANPLSSEVWRRAYPGGYELLEVGYPRDDRFFRATPEEIAGIRGGLGIAAGDTAVLYAPTYRDDADGARYPLDPARLAGALGPGYVLLVRAHYFDTFDIPAPAAPGGARVVDVSAHPAVEDLCLAADVLVTDYSSIMFDYAHLDRPIVIHAPDWDTYRTTRGVTFDLLAEPPGPVTTTEDELAARLRDGTAAGPESAKARAAFRETFCVFDDGHAAEHVVRRVFLGERGGPARR